MSSKKSLLNEAQVRKFMKLAKLEPFASSFVNEMDYRDDPEDLDELRTGRTGALGPKGGTANPGHGRGQGEAANGSLFEQEPPLPDEEPLPGEGEELGGEEEELGAEEEELGGEEEMEADVELAPGGGDEGRMVSVDDFLSALETALEDAIGDEVEIDSDEMEAGAEEEEMGGEEEELGGEEEMGGEEEELDADEEEMFQEGWEHPKSATGSPNTHKGSKQHPDHRNKKNSKGGLASQGPGLVKEEDDDDDKDKDDVSESTNDLVEEITKRVAARILKSALRK